MLLNIDEQESKILGWLHNNNKKEKGTCDVNRMDVNKMLVR